MVQLDLFSDPICPWCYIGKTLLDRALESRPDHPFRVEWHPFQLNPDMPADGMDRRAYLEAKFGGKDNAVKVYARVAEAAEAAGLAIDFGAIRRTPNTMNAHRLIHWAGLEGRQTLAAAALFKAYFTDGRDIGDVAVLTAIAGEIGLDAGAIGRLFGTDADLEALRARDAHARSRGITAVPTFIIANHYVLSGAQPVALWQQAIDELSAQLDGAQNGRNPSPSA